MTSSFQELVKQIKETETFDKEVVLSSVSDQIAFLMKKDGVKKAELARRLGKSRAYITKILQGNVNFTIDTLVQIARALGYQFVPSFAPQEWQPSMEVHLTARASGTTCRTTLNNDDSYVQIVLDEEDGDERNTSPIVG